MTDEEIKEEFYKWKPENLPEYDIESGIDCWCIYYNGFRAAERLSKIEVLEEVKNKIEESCDEFGAVSMIIDSYINELKEGQ